MIDYHIKQLICPESQIFAPIAINEDGLILGNLLPEMPNYETSEPAQAVILCGDAFTNLGVFDTSDINNLGQVTGTILNNYDIDSSGTYLSQSVVWEGSLHQIFEEQVINNSVSINDKCEVVGCFGRRSSERLIYVWSREGFRTISPPEGFVILYVRDMNSFGNIVACVAPIQSKYDQYMTFGCLYSGGEWQIINCLNEPCQGDALKINEKNDVLCFSSNVVFSSDDSEADFVFVDKHPGFLWSGGKVTDLCMQGRDLNDLGTVVGTLDRGNDMVAALWANGNVHDLNGCIPTASGWYLERAEAINNAGQIIGIGLFRGKIAAYLLQPIH